MKNKHRIKQCLSLLLAGGIALTNLGAVTLTALCDVLLFRDELFYYESFGLFAVLILVQLAATGVAAFHIYQEKRKKIE